MPLPQPVPGLVIHYEYLWRHEHLRGDDAGAKRRPCAIIVATTTVEGELKAIVAPITHLEPVFPSDGVEIPPRVKAYLGLDTRRSWIIATDLNTFFWPGVDVYPVPNSPPGTFEYGQLPPKLLEMVKERIIANKTVITPRSD